MARKFTTRAADDANETPQYFDSSVDRAVNPAAIPMLRYFLVLTLLGLSAQATAQQFGGGGAAFPTQPAPSDLPTPPAPEDLDPGQIWVYIHNIYGRGQADTTTAVAGINLSVLGLPSVTRRGYDQAYGTLTRDGDVYRGELDATAVGIFEAPGCSDHSSGTQKLWAVAHIERPPRTLSASDTLLAGATGEFELFFHFLPNVDPVFTVGPGDCQGTLRFEGYGGGGNPARYEWLPQRWPARDFLPFNDTRWTTQNGLDVVAPQAGGRLHYTTVRHPGVAGATTLWLYHLVRAR